MKDDVSHGCTASWNFWYRQAGPAAPRRAMPRRAAPRCAAPIPEDLEENIKAAVKFGFSGLVSAVR